MASSPLKPLGRSALPYPTSNLPAPMPWRQFLRHGWTWKQGEHVTLIGPTGSGKSTLARAILPYRSYVAVIATKPRDPTLERFRRDGYRVSKTWPTYGERILFWPKIGRMSDVATQSEAIATMLSNVYESGGWCVYLDEARYITEWLGLERSCELLWLQGRALGVSMVASAQRPRHLPLAAYSQASHLFVWRNRDRQDLRRLAEMSGQWDAAAIVDLIGSLDDHQCAYLRAGDDQVTVTVVE